MSKQIGDYAKDLVDDAKDFVQDSTFFINRCTKPDKKGIFVFLVLWLIMLF